ncbi:MipA/OmpV family protein [Marinomonas sp. M1K-6]|uniref:MipA/OmpV family protein n=1 Tax=Marinomonas profundi TaxID=2726122 RepID=A0A847R6H2_9GAMM|nr:MipA/OmpV family protein [Marinomonas profundi]NLQ16514.1 MipA/OmpV family protein [Marinomonas profundi]UDV03897.1 MipA/OmpV family protein [Marinomonas profundi]
MDIIQKIILVSITLTPLIAHADGDLGVIGAMSQSIYKDVDSRSAFLPNINYQGEHFFIGLPETGYRFLPKKSVQNAAIGLSYDSSSFDPDDSDDINIQQLDDRDASIMAFASYKYGPVTTKLAQDISGEHDGYYAQISAGYPIPMGHWKIIPTISYRYMNSKMSNHLFGISPAESNRTGGSITAHDADAISFVRYGVRGMYSLSQNISLMLGVVHTKYDDDVLKSAIVEDNASTSVLAGVFVSF